MDVLKRCSPPGQRRGLGDFSYWLTSLLVLDGGRNKIPDLRSSPRSWGWTELGDLGSLSLMMKRGRKRKGWWLVSRVATGSGLPHTVLALTLEFLCPGIPVSLRPGQTSHPTPAGQAIPQSVSYPERQSGCDFGSWRKKFTSSQSLRVPPAVKWHFLNHCPGVGPVQRASGLGLRPAGEWGAAGGGADRTVYGSLGLVPEDDWAPASICCERTVFLPCQSCICISVTCCSGPAYSSPWLVFPPSIFLLPLLSKLVLNSRDFFQHPGWELQQLDRLKAVEMGMPWLPRSEGELVALALPRGLSHVGSYTSPYHGGTVAQRSWGWGTKLFWIYPVALRLFLKMKNDSSFLNLVCLRQCYEEKAKWRCYVW